MSTLRQKTIRNSLFNFLAYLIPIVFTVFLTPLIIHRLGVEQYGIFVLASVITGFFGLLRFGLGYGATKIVSRYHGDGNTKDVSEVLSSTILLLIVIGLVGALVSMSVGLFAADLFHINSISTETVLLIFSIAGIGFFFTSVGSALTATLTGLQRLDVYSKIYLFGITGMNIAMLIAVSFGRGVVTLIAIQCAAYGLISTGYYVAVRRLIPEIPLRFRYYHAQFKPFLKLNGYAYLHETAGTLLFELDKILVSTIAGPAAVSYYSVAGTISQKIQGAVGSLTAILLPISSSLQARDEHERLRNMYQQTMRAAAIISASLMLAVLLFGRPLLQYWLGADFVANSLTALYILAVTYLLLALFITASHFLLGLGKARELAGYTMLFAVLNIILLCVLLPTYGITGAAWAYLLSLAPLPFVLYRIERKILGITSSSPFYLKLTSQLIVAGTVCVLVSFFGLLPFVHGLVGVIVAGGLSGLVFVATFRVFGFFSDNERQLLEKVLSRFTAPRDAIVRLVHSQKKFDTYEKSHLLLPDCADKSLCFEYQKGNLTRLNKPIKQYYDELTNQIVQAVTERKSKVIIRASDGEAHFLAGKLRGNGPRRHFTSGAILDPQYVARFRDGLLACDSRHVEMYRNNQRAFRRLFGRDIFSPIPFETIYALIANRSLLRQPYKIGLIGSEKKLNIIQQLLKNEKYRDYIGRQEFQQYIGVPETGSSNDVDALIRQITSELDPEIDIYLVGIGIAKLAVLPVVAKHSHAVFLDVGAGISALAGLVSGGRPYFADWTNFRLRDFDYNGVDQMDLQVDKDHIVWLP